MLLCGCVACMRATRSSRDQEIYGRRGAQSRPSPDEKKGICTGAAKIMRSINSIYVQVVAPIKEVGETKKEKEALGPRTVY